jgi:two-component system, NtrC family, sensor kinase
MDGVVLNLSSWQNMNIRGSQASYRILVIDDNPDIHQDFRKILCEDRSSGSQLEATEAKLFGDDLALGNQSSFEVDSAHQGEEGLARVYHAIQEGRPYAMAFVDVRMPPGWDGIEVTPRLWIADPDLQIVICTAYSDYSWEEMFARLGTSDRMFILKKPFERAEVLQLAHSLTEKRRLLEAGKRRQKRLEPSAPAQANALERVSEELNTEIIRLKRDGSAGRR